MRIKESKAPKKITRFIIVIFAIVFMAVAVSAFGILHHTSNEKIKLTFTLQDHNNVTVTEKAYEGKWLLIYFGFINCPDICPTQMSSMQRIISALRIKDQSSEFLPIMITVDPARDNPTAMNDYVSSFDNKIIGLTGNLQVIKKLLRSLEAYASFSNITDSDQYQVNHSDYFYLVNPLGFVEKVYSGKRSHAQIASDISSIFEIQDG